MKYNPTIDAVIRQMPSNRRAAITLRSTAHSTARRRWRWRRAQDLVSSPPADVAFTWDNRRPGTAGFARWTAAVGRRIDEHGLDHSTRDLDNLIGVARQLGAAPVAVDVLADSTQPDPARLRAFALVVSALVGSRATPPERHRPQ
jgi:hypothetical protein